VGNTAFFQRTDSTASFPRITTFQFTLVPSLYPAPTLSLVQLFATLNVSFAGNSVLNAKGRPTLLGAGRDGNNLQVVIARKGAQAAGTSAVSTSASLSVGTGPAPAPAPGPTSAPAPAPARVTSPASRLGPGWFTLAACVLMGVLAF